MIMKRALLILLAAASAAHAQTTSITVMADTNRAVRTNFTIGNAQVTGLSALLDAKLATNGNASALTNITAANVVGTVATASNITGILAISNGGTGASSASNARTALGLGSAATNDASAFQPASATLTNLANGDGSGLTNISGSANPTGDGGSLTNLAATNIVGSVPVASGGTGGTNADSALASLLPAYASNAGKVLAVDTNETGVEWITAGGGGGSGTVTSVDASGGSTGLLFTGGPITTNGTITLGGTLAIGNGGTGASDLTNARINLLPAYTNNAGKVLALNTNGTDLEWVSVAAAPVSIVNGGTGGTNTNSALQGLGLVNSNGSAYTLLTTNFDFSAVRIASTNTGQGISIGSKAKTPSGSSISPVAIGHLSQVVTNSGIAIGREALVFATTNSRDSFADAAEGAAVGPYATARSGGAVGRSADTWNGAAVGKGAYSIFGGAMGADAGTDDGGAVGWNAYSVNGFAGGKDAYAYGTNGVQLGAGANNSNNMIQFLSAGLVDTNEWALIAALSTYPTTNISVVGTNNTNTLVFSNGILVEVQ